MARGHKRSDKPPNAASGYEARGTRHWLLGTGQWGSSHWQEGECREAKGIRTRTKRTHSPRAKATGGLQGIATAGQSGSAWAAISQAHGRDDSPRPLYQARSELDPSQALTQALTVALVLSLWAVASIRHSLAAGRPRDPQHAPSFLVADCPCASTSGLHHQTPWGSGMGAPTALASWSRRLIRPCTDRPTCECDLEFRMLTPPNDSGRVSPNQIWPCSTFTFWGCNCKSESQRRHGASLTTHSTQSGSARAPVRHGSRYEWSESLQEPDQPYPMKLPVHAQACSFRTKEHGITAPSGPRAVLCRDNPAWRRKGVLSPALTLELGVAKE